MTRIPALVTGSALALAALPALAETQTGDGRWAGHMGGYGMMGGGGIVMMLLMVVLVAAVVVLVWKAMTGHGTAPRHDAALTTLRDRFARGEIDEAEYRTRKTALDG